MIVLIYLLFILLLIFKTFSPLFIWINDGSWH